MSFRAYTQKPFIYSVHWRPIDFLVSSAVSPPLLPLSFTEHFNNHVSSYFLATLRHGAPSLLRTPPTHIISLATASHTRPICPFLPFPFHLFIQFQFLPRSRLYRPLNMHIFIFHSDPSLFTPPHSVSIHAILYT